MGKIFEIDRENLLHRKIFEIDHENPGYLRKRPPFQNPGTATGHTSCDVVTRHLLGLQQT
jgi:hypothetical protein